MTALSFPPGQSYLPIRRAMKLTGSIWAIVLAAVATTACGSKLQQQLQSQLLPSLSKGASISSTAPARWSEFDAPDPGAVINVATEQDVVTSVRYCTQNKMPFLAQNGGNGWSTTVGSLTTNGVIINLAGLDQVTFSPDKKQATIGGGANISTTINAAYNAGVLVETGNCNCVGTLGAILGAGYGNLMGLYSFGIDNVLSLRVVTANGILQNVTAKSNPDLFWALRGAGPNLGIVTSATVNAYPAEADDFLAWTGDLIYTEDKLEDVVQAIQDLVLTPEMVIFLYFLAGSDGTPVVVASPFLYKGNATSGQEAFASLYAIGPVEDTTTVVEYNEWNAGTNALCTRGDYKPGWAAGFQNMVPSTWRAMWNAYTAFQALPGAENSGLLLEAYDLTKARTFPSGSAAFPNRNVNFNAFVIPWYNDSSLDPQAEELGNTVRNLLRSTSGLPQNQTYINFAHGDEDLSVVYGNSLTRLKTIKKTYDPLNVFSHWFDIQ
ncbi:FAD binding domain-containing protein [Xylariaceae sp. FL0255]|nr:FAD binding domain-containing protein [Xylariaceae sp. FL0255]